MNNLKTNIKILNIKNIQNCINLIKKNTKDYNYYQRLGWKKEQFINQIKKNINYSLALIENDIIIGFMLGDLLISNKKIEYEILFIYIDEGFRNRGNGRLLLESLFTSKFNFPLTKIHLEVEASNMNAIYFYKKNQFAQVGIRKNYYKLFENKKIDAILFTKIINE